MNRLEKYLTEKEIKYSIVDFLQQRNIMHWVNNVGAFKQLNKDGSYRTVSFNPKGMSDIACIYRGKYIAIEVKNYKEYIYIMDNYDRIKSGRLKTIKEQHILNQISFIENLIKNGCYGFFSCSMDNVRNVLSKIDHFLEP